jgi:hypothetical protein
MVAKQEAKERQLNYVNTFKKSPQIEEENVDLED